MDWHEALHQCFLLNAELATVDSVELLKQLRHNLPKRKFYWTAGVRVSSNMKQFIWLHTGEYITEYWQKGEPNSSPYRDERCVNLADSSGKYGLSDSLCEAKFHFICEKMTKKVFVELGI